MHRDGVVLILGLLAFERHCWRLAFKGQLKLSLEIWG